MSDNPASILVADFGSVHTRVLLIELVEGVYRLVARSENRTTDGYPVHDITVGFDRALRQLTEETGRQFMAEGGQVITPERPDRSGVDLFAITASIGRPLRAVVVGLIPELSIASTIRAAAGTYIEVVQIVSLDDGRTEEERLNAILLSYPDVVVIAGGTEQGAKSAVLQLSKVVQLAVSLTDRQRRPTVIYSGNSALSEQISELFEGLTTLLLAENVRPSLIDERLDSARLQLVTAFDHYKEHRSEGFAAIGAMSQTGVLPSAQGYNIVADYLGRLHPGGVALIDMGSSTTTFAISQQQRVKMSIRTDIGLGHSASTLLDVAGLEAVRRWLPFNISDNELQNYALNKLLRPATVPVTVRDLYIEQALLKAGIQAAITAIIPNWQRPVAPLEVAIGAGAALTNTGHPAYDGMLLLDALQPAGITVLLADPYSLIPAMGAVALQTPAAVVQLLDNHNLAMLGTAINLSGRPRVDKPAMRVKITLQDGEVIQQTVMGGHLWVYPLPIGESAEVRVKCLSGTSVNGKRGVKLNLFGGTAGLIFDARGRPLPLASDVRVRAVQIPAWAADVTGYPVQEIDPAWLEDIRVEQPKSEDEKKRGSRAVTDRRRKAQAESETPGDDFDELTEADKDDELDELRNVLS